MPAINLRINRSGSADYLDLDNSCDKYIRDISIDRSLSFAHNIIHEPRPVRSAEYYQQLNTKEINDCSKRLHKTLNTYRLNRVEDTITNQDAMFVSSAGKPYRLLASAKHRFPSEYWATFKHESIAPSSLYSHGRPFLYYKPWEVPSSQAKYY